MTTPSFHETEIRVNQTDVHTLLCVERRFKAYVKKNNPYLIKGLDS